MPRPLCNQCGRALSPTEVGARRRPTCTTCARTLEHQRGTTLQRGYGHHHRRL